MNRIELSSFIKIPMNEQESVLPLGSRRKRILLLYQRQKRNQENSQDDGRTSGRYPREACGPSTASRSSYREDGCMYDSQGKDGL